MLTRKRKQIERKKKDTYLILHAGLKITAGQRTVSGLITDLTGQTLIFPIILTGHFWI